VRGQERRVASKSYHISEVEGEIGGIEGEKCTVRKHKL